MPAIADFGVIGGSGFYEFLTDAEEVKVDTPFGEPSETITVGELAGRRVAFLPRHGKDHRFPPHKIPYRANLWALRSVGVRRVLAPSAVGSLTPSYGPGTLVIPDQMVDRTRNRIQTFYDVGAVHVPFADPYCPSGRSTAISAARSFGWVPAGSGTLVIIEGQRFSTRAESLWYSAQGWSIIGMTGHPEAVLARELALCYTPLCLITDTDAGVDEGEGVTQAEVFEAFGANVKRLRDLVARIIETFPAEREDDLCAHALDGIKLPFELPLYDTACAEGPWHPAVREIEVGCQHEACCSPVPADPCRRGWPGADGRRYGQRCHGADRSGDRQGTAVSRGHNRSPR